MLANMATSLILHKRIHTTVAKAKALRSYIEPIITRSKEDTTHSRRMVFSYLQSKEAVNELFREISVKVADRPGGYTRIIKTGTRLGDAAEMCMMELVDFNENLLKTTESGKSTTGRRRRRGSKKPAPAAAASQPADTATAEKPVEEKSEQAPEATVAEPAQEETPAAEAAAENDAPVSEAKAEATPTEAEEKKSEPAAQEETGDEKNEADTQDKEKEE
ncbi:MAG: hypothetical protein Kow00127_06470 [Bacteroidales bacterium]